MMFLNDPINPIAGFCQVAEDTQPMQDRTELQDTKRQLANSTPGTDGSLFLTYEGCEPRLNTHFFKGTCSSVPKPASANICRQVERGWYSLLKQLSTLGLH